MSLHLLPKITSPLLYHLCLNEFQVPNAQYIEIASVHSLDENMDEIQILIYSVNKTRSIVVSFKIFRPLLSCKAIASGKRWISD